MLLIKVLKASNRKLKEKGKVRCRELDLRIVQPIASVLLPFSSKKKRKRRWNLLRSKLFRLEKSPKAPYMHEAIELLMRLLISLRQLINDIH